MPDPSKSLCAACSLFVKRWQTEHWLDCTSVLAPDFKSLKISATQGCPLCQLVHQACIYQGYETWLSEINEPITLEAFAFREDDSEVNSGSGKDNDDGSESVGEDDDDLELSLRVSIHGSGFGFEFWMDDASGKPPVWRGPVEPRPIHRLQVPHTTGYGVFNDGIKPVVLQAQRWIRDCISQHPDCSKLYKTNKAPDKIRPTRLIDVGSEDSNNPAKLFIPEHSTSTALEYIALSYAWGPNTAWSKTTKSNMQTMLRGLPWKALPNTIRDAITFTRMLGYKYIWIDALCIIQAEGPNDSVHQADWVWEAARFGEYYQNAVLTIAATGAEGSAKGLFLERPGLEFDTKPLSIGQRQRAKHKLETFVYPTVPLWTTEIERSPLHIRGWASQERILSQRIIHFAANCVLWECRRCRATEVNPRGLWSIEEAGTWPGEDFVPAYRSEESSSADLQRRYWHSFVNAYSNKAFSFYSDRLPALSGIAAGVHKRVQTEYLAGIWEDSISEGLAWMVNGKFREESQASLEARKKPGAMVVPSWSWACARGSVDFLCTLGKWTNLIHLQSSKMNVKGAPTSGQLTDASLSVKGRIKTFNFSDLGLIPCLDENKENTLEPEPDPSRWRRDNAVYLDTLSAKNIVNKAYVCFLVGSVDLLPIYKGGGIKVGGALVLESMGWTASVECFRRIGLVCLPFDDYWANCQDERMITLV